MPRPPANFAPSVQWLVSPFADAEELARRYRFAEGYPLRERLDAVGRRYRSIRFVKGAPRRWPSPRERRDRLELVEAEARAMKGGGTGRAVPLALALYRAPSGLPGCVPDIEHCFDRDPQLDGARAVFPDVIEAAFTLPVLDRILREVAAQRRDLRRAQGRAAQVPGLHLLVANLAVIWQEGTGKRPTVSTNPVTGKRGGRFPRFLLDVVRHVDAELPTSTDALAALHRRSRG